MDMLRLWVLALAAFGVVQSAQAQIEVHGPWITLGDVAQLRGAAAEKTVAPAPAPGQSLALDPVFVARVAEEAGVRVDVGDAPIWVSRAAPTAAIAPAAPIAPVAPSAPSVNPFDDIAPQPGYVLVFAEDMRRGDILSVDDLDWAPPSRSAGLPTGLAVTKSAVLGLELKRGAREGRPVRLPDLRQAAAVKKGEPVTLTYTSAGLRLSVEGRALADAAPGAPVRVMNLYSKRAVEAVAVAPGEARVLQR